MRAMVGEMSFAVMAPPERDRRPERCVVADLVPLREGEPQPTNFQWGAASERQGAAIPERCSSAAR